MESNWFLYPIINIHIIHCSELIKEMKHVHFEDWNSPDKPTFYHLKTIIMQDAYNLQKKLTKEIL